MRRPSERRRAGPVCLLWAALALPALTAGRLGLDEPRAAWWPAAGQAVLAVAVGVSRHRPLTAFTLTAALSLADAWPPRT